MRLLLTPVPLPARVPRLSLRLGLTAAAVLMLVVMAGEMGVPLARGGKARETRWRQGRLLLPWKSRSVLQRKIRRAESGVVVAVVVVVVAVVEVMAVVISPRGRWRRRRRRKVRRKGCLGFSTTAVVSRG